MNKELTNKMITDVLKAVKSADLESKLPKSHFIDTDNPTLTQLDGAPLYTDKENYSFQYQIWFPIISKASKEELHYRKVGKVLPPVNGYCIVNKCNSNQYNHSTYDFKIHLLKIETSTASVQFPKF
jgi:hypothetical protein